MSLINVTSTPNPTQPIPHSMNLKAIDLDPSHSNSIYNYAVLLDSGLQNKDKAEIMYRKCLEVNEKHSFCLYNLAVLIEDLRGHTEEGKEESNKFFIGKELERSEATS